MAVELPQVNGDHNTWGTKLNAALTELVDSVTTASTTATTAASAAATAAAQANTADAKADGAVSATVALEDRIADLEAAENPVGNVLTLPDWNGVGTHPVRPLGLPEGTRVIWPQPTAPLTSPNYARPGDRWEAIDL